jgi:hypothetical protein
MRPALVLLAGCTVFVNGPPKERTDVTPVIDCTDRYTLPSIDLALTAALAGGTIAGWKYSDSLTEECDGLGCFILPMATAMIIVMPLVTAHGFERVHACRETKARDARWRGTEEARNARARAREHAWVLTKQAAIAARADNCELVRETSAKVRAEDADFHAAVFANDVAIARCLK